MITADQVVDAIACGVGNALAVSQRLLGAEASDFEHPKIHPEYLVSVEVAKSLSGPDRVVVLETHMDQLRSNAERLALRKARFKPQGQYRARRAEIAKIVARPAYQFSGEEQGQGKKRVDIAVFRSEPREAPLVIAEAKLGRQSPSAIISDIDRVICLLRLHKELNCEGPLYGAVFFYRMLKGGTYDGVRGRAANILRRINAHLEVEQAKPDQTWLTARADLLTRGSFHEPIQAYEEPNPDGTSSAVFARKGFAFAPGLVLLGSTEDVRSVAM